MLYDGIQMSKDEGAEELEEVQATLRRQEEDVGIRRYTPFIRKVK